MTRQRYLSYRLALTTLHVLDVNRVGAEALALLHDAAEGLLLAREASTDTDELAEDAAVALTQMTVRGAISRDLAQDVLEAICGSGPPEVQAAVERLHGAPSPSLV